MPLPGSQKADTVDIAYFLHTYRWIFRAVFALCILIGARQTLHSQKLVGRIGTTLALVFLTVVIYMFNFRMKADRMFLQPNNLLLLAQDQNKIPDEKLVLGYACENEARAYPIQLIAYHHQVLDTVCGEQIMVTYCSVCRTGRIYKPEIEGTPASFRLVGMDHFNAMFEDNRTQSWWMQETGVAIAGNSKGKALPELLSEQMPLSQWLSFYPNSLIMQYDSAFQEEYDSLDTYDIGLGRGKLTGTDTLSWKDKSWVIGIELSDTGKAYDWNELKRQRIIHDNIGKTPIVLVLANDNQSFFAFERPSTEAQFAFQNDTLFFQDNKYDLAGKAQTPGTASLKKLQVYQEFWHSWRTFRNSPQ